MADERDPELAALMRPPAGPIRWPFRILARLSPAARRLLVRLMHRSHASEAHKQP